jgi:hypothetical protein
MFIFDICLNMIIVLNRKSGYSTSVPIVTSGIVSITNTTRTRDRVALGGKKYI